MKEKLYDATRINDGQACMRYLYWRHVRHVVPTEPALAAEFGIGLHHGLAERYRGKALAHQCEAFLQHWNSTCGSLSDSKRSAQAGLRILTSYHNTYPHEHFRVLSVETPFLIPLPNNFWLCGIIDLTYEQAGLGVMDHKSTSIMNDWWWQVTLNPSNQFTLYLYAVSVLTGKMPSFLMVNGIHVPASGKNPKFERRPTNRNVEDIKKWLHDTSTFLEYVEHCKKANSFPQSPIYCGRWMGRACQYHDLCTTPGIDYRTYEPPETLFRYQVWDPVANLRNHGLEV